MEDGSCLLDTCLGDVDGDNSVTVSDLLEILAEFGCTEGCTTDISGDGSTTVVDLLEVVECLRQLLRLTRIAVASAKFLQGAM